MAGFAAVEPDGCQGGLCQHDRTSYAVERSAPTGVGQPGDKSPPAPFASRKHSGEALLACGVGILYTPAQCTVLFNAKLLFFLHKIGWHGMCKKEVSDLF